MRAARTERSRPQVDSLYGRDAVDETLGLILRNTSDMMKNISTLKNMKKYS